MKSLKIRSKKQWTIRKTTTFIVKIGDKSHNNYKVNLHQQRQQVFHDDLDYKEERYEHYCATKSQIKEVKTIA